MENQNIQQQETLANQSKKGNAGKHIWSIDIERAVKLYAGINL